MIDNMENDESINLEEVQNDPSFYTSAITYWDKVTPTIRGMLGGHSQTSPIDLKASENFLNSIFELDNAPDKVSVVDCGAGIGRISKNLLLKYFAKVDLVEQCENFIMKAKENLSEHKNVKFHCIGLQDFSAPSNTYDIVWCQWVLGHLNDKDLELFFYRMIKCLKPNGVIVVKENFTSSDTPDFDEEDSSITRPVSALVDIFHKAGLEILINRKQARWPRGFYQVRMFCLKPRIQK